MSDDRRQFYRVTPDNKDKLELRLKTASDEVGRGGVIDVSIQGVGARFPADDAPVLAVEDEVMLCFDSPDLEKTIEVKATVAAHWEMDTHRHYGFEFGEKNKLERTLPEQVYRLFNRRAAFRGVEIKPETLVDIASAIPHENLGEVIATGLLQDISTTGIGVLFDPAMEHALDKVSLVEVRLQLPGDYRPTKLTAQILRRQNKEGGTHYGMRFDPDASKDFLDQLEDISSYLLSRYDELVKERET